MELLNESESRAFSSFLDSFASTASSPAGGFSPPPPPPSSLPPQPFPHYSNQENGATTQSWRSSEGQSNEGNRITSGASNGLNGWNASPYHHAPYQQQRQQSTFAPPRSNPYYQQQISTSSSSSSSSNFAHRLSPPPSAPPISHSHSQQQQHQQQDSEAAKLRKLQHAEELEKWMAQSRPVQPRQQQETHQTSDDIPSPPKRTRSSEEYPERQQRSKDRGNGFMQGDPIAMMLEAERKAGYAYGRSLNAASIAPSTTSVSRFSPPPPPPPQTRTRRDSDSDFVPPPPPPPASSSRSTRRRPSTSLNSQVEASGSMAAPPQPPPKSSKRKAPVSTSSSSRSTPRTSTSGKPAPPPSTTTLNSDSPSPLDPESTDSTLASIPPIPLSTPSNIPRIKPRSRPTRRRRRLSSSSNSPAPSIASTSTSTHGKPALLSAEQKKANHIASEQKRRAAIRKGYDGLCDVVPVLREAVEEFEERVRRLESEGNGKKKRGKGKGGDFGGGGGGKTGALMGGINVGGEKIDGRAGPKSEAVVLSKTVDHVRQLLLNRATLLERLSNAYSQAEERGIEIPPAIANEWDEPWDGGSDEEEDLVRVKREEGAGEGEDEEMWEDE